jgi:hypothetical protein
LTEHDVVAFRCGSLLRCGSGRSPCRPERQVRFVFTMPVKQEVVLTNIAQLQSQSYGFLSTTIAALHESRRLEAINVIHRYRHLGSDRVEINLCDPTPSPDTKTRARQILNNGSDKKVRRSSETYLMILILLGFGVVHVIGGVLIQRASIRQGNPPLAVVAQGD